MPKHPRQNDTLGQRTLALTDSLALGGTERQMALLLKHLPEGWQARLWSLDDGPFADKVREANVRVDIRLRSWRWDPLPARDLWRLIRSWKPSVVHTFGHMATLAAIPACRFSGIPLVNGTIRQAKVPGWRSLLVKLGLAFSDKVIGNSQTGLDAFGVPPAKGRVVYNGFDPDRRHLCNRTNRSQVGTFTAVMVARMHQQKDYWSFLEAARALSDRDPSWRFWVIGNGPTRPEVLARGRDLITRGTLYVPDPCLEVLPLVREADVGVLMSEPRFHQEGCSNAIMEYMACALPVVCSESGGNRELVLEGETGFLVAPRDAEHLVERLGWLRSRPDVCQRLGESGRKRVAQSFSIEAMVAGTVAVYGEVIRREVRTAHR